MKWNDLKKKKPETDMVCYVFNDRYGATGLKAIYHKHDDVFVLYNPDIRDTICVDVTHWIELPETFIKK